MKRMLILLAALILLIGCSDKTDDEVNANEETNNSNVGQEDTLDNEIIEDDFDIDELVANAKEESSEDDKELYLLMINNLIYDFDEAHEEFTMESGTNFFKLFRTDVATNGLDVAIDNTNKLLDVLGADDKELFSMFLDELIEIEESFPDLEQFIIE